MLCAKFFSESNTVCTKVSKFFFGHFHFMKSRYVCNRYTASFKYFETAYVCNKIKSCAFDYPKTIAHILLQTVTDISENTQTSFAEFITLLV